MVNSTISGMITAIFMYWFYYQGWESLAAGMCIGFFVYVSIALYESFIVKRYLKKTRLFILLMVNTLSQVLIILLIAGLYVGIFYLKGHFEMYFTDYSTFFSKAFITGLIFGLLLSMIFSFITITGTIIGKQNLGKLFIGRYSKPSEEDRIFMFLDLTSSTAIAEKTGHLKFLSLLNDFYTDIVEPIDQTRGEIYKYVGDEVIITWKKKEGIKDGNCLQCFLLIQEKITGKSEVYMKKYGLVPEFKAGIHGGTVVIGEMGYSRREIAFVGDVLNTTSRIMGECKTFNRPVLVSEDVIKMLDMPGHITAYEVGNAVLRGKAREMKLYGINY